MITLHVLDFTSLLVAGVAAGLQLMQVVVGRASATLAGPVYVETQQVISSSTARCLSFFAALTVVAALAVDQVFAESGDASAALATAGAAFLAATVAAVSLAAISPLDRRIRAWNPAHLPAEWASIRARSLRYQRTCFGMSFAAFLLLVASVALS